MHSIYINGLHQKKIKASWERAVPSSGQAGASDDRNKVKREPCQPVNCHLWHTHFENLLLDFLKP
jgi:hypothetical protein